MGPQDPRGFHACGGCTDCQVDGAHGAFVEIGEGAGDPGSGKGALPDIEVHRPGCARRQQMIGFSPDARSRASERREPAGRDRRRCVRVEKHTAVLPVRRAHPWSASTALSANGVDSTGHGCWRWGPSTLSKRSIPDSRSTTKTGVQTRGYTDFSSFVNLPSPWNGFCIRPPGRLRSVVRAVHHVDPRHRQHQSQVLLLDHGVEDLEPQRRLVAVAVRLDNRRPGFRTVARLRQPGIGPVGPVCRRQFIRFRAGRAGSSRAGCGHSTATS